ncbi:hypothetical protein CLOM_g17484 [Closterium sp. NIES-68]|nr:hypothetical protein CLOM_g17484 [Closterium sp. NIES-68]GJP59501.1 hypothetical protein CLOP_g12284 [Closterium sp. NIES-67]
MAAEPESEDGAEKRRAGANGAEKRRAGANGAEGRDERGAEGEAVDERGEDGDGERGGRRKEDADEVGEEERREEQASDDRGGKEAAEEENEVEGGREAAEEGREPEDGQGKEGEDEEYEDGNEKAYTDGEEEDEGEEDDEREEGEEEDEEDEEEEEEGEEGDYDDQSPVEEVALTVATFDDPALPCFTYRVMIIGSIVCALLAFVNQYFWFRTQSIIINPIAAIILSLYMGRLLARIERRYFNPDALPFSVKEHVLIGIFANCGSAFGNGNAYAIDIVTIMKQFYNVQLGFFPAFLLVTTTQVLGYGWAGLFRRYLVRRRAGRGGALSLTLHESDTPARGMLTRAHFFFLITAISFCWYLVPGYLIPIVSCLSWVCWVWPTSITAQQLGSGLRGMGLGAITLDWATMSAFLSSPLAAPWFAILNIAVGFALFLYVLVPICYWGDVFAATRFPFLSSGTYQWSGALYPVDEIITSDFRLNETMYAQQNLAPYISVFFALAYGLGFAALTATVVHVALWYGPEIYQRTMSAATEVKPDVHTRLMQRYPKVPWWWFLILLLVNLAVCIAFLELNAFFQLPWWGLLLSAALSLFFTLPIGIVTATTNQQPGLNIITEMIWGYIRPGEPIGNVCFKTYGYISMTQAIAFLQDFKLGHYMKIPPQAMFAVQVFATILAGLVNLGTAWWLYDTVEGGLICKINDENFPENSPWTCPTANVFYSASIIWGLIGPERMFGPNAFYNNLNWWFLGGALAPIPFWALHKLWPRQTWLTKVHIPVMLTGVGMMPPATPINYIGWITMGFIFNKLIFTYRKDWWRRYNYVLSAALDSGVMFMALFIFFGAQVETPSVSLAWWGAGVTSSDNCPLAMCPTDPSAITTVISACPTYAGS